MKSYHHVKTTSLKIYFPKNCKKQTPFIFCSMTSVPPNQHNFHIAVDAIFKNWTGLQLAVRQGAAGPYSSAKGSWLVDATVQWFSENKNLEVYEVEEFLEDILNQEFNLIVEDGSVNEVSKLVCEYFSHCNTLTEEEVVKRLKQLPKCDLSTCKVEDVDENDTNAEEEDHNNIDTREMMEVEENEKETPPLTDSDGWTVVPRKKSRNKIK